VLLGWVADAVEDVVNADSEGPGVAGGGAVTASDGG